MIVKRSSWLVVMSALPACIYLSPINAPPVVEQVSRVCDPIITPCDFTDVHPGDDLKLAVSFTDPEHHEAEVSFEWSAEACDKVQSVCVAIAISDPAASSPAFTVPATLGDTASPVELVRVTIELRDDRGAHDIGGALIPIVAP
jgi:hypothetical protein